MIGIAVRAASEGVLVVGGPLSRNGRTDPPGKAIISRRLGETV